MLKEEICDPNFSEQKDAANLASLTDVNLKFNIFPNILGLNIFIGQTGDLNVSIKFENPDALNKFEENYISIIADLKESLVFKENNFVGVCAYTYEKEAASTET